MPTDTAIPLARLTPGWFLRQWAGYTVRVQVRRFSAGGPLWEIPPSGYPCSPETMPDALWFPL